MMCPLADPLPWSTEASPNQLCTGLSYDRAAPQDFTVKKPPFSGTCPYQCGIRRRPRPSCAHEVACARPITEGRQRGKRRWRRGGSVAVVLHVITRAQRRGAEVAACALHDRLAALGGDWSGGTVVALAPGSDGSPLDVPVLGASPRGPATLAALRSRAAGADVVVAHGSATLWACAAALAGRSQPPFVYVSIGDPRYWAARRARRLRTKLALSRARAVVALAPAASEALQDWYDVPADRVRVLPNTRSAGRFRPATGRERAEARRRFGLPATADVVLALGSLTPEKRPLPLATAALAVPGCHVLVVGDGPLRARPRGPGPPEPGARHGRGSARRPATGPARRGRAGPRQRQRRTARRARGSRPVRAAGGRDRRRLDR